MAYRKDIIVITGGRNKGVVKLSTSVGRSGYLKGACSLDFAPRSGILYLIGDKISEIDVKAHDFAFEIPDFAQKEISCVLLSAAPPMFGTTKKGADRGAVIASVERYKAKKNQGASADDHKVKPTIPAENKPCGNCAKADLKEKQDALKRVNLEENVEIDFDTLQDVACSEEPDKKENPDSVEKERSAEDNSKIEFGNNNKRDGFIEENMKDLKKGEYDKDRHAEVASDAAGAFSIGGVNYDGGNFYQAIKPQLDEMFVCYPAEDTLNNAVPNSSWVRIDTDDDYYVVGVLFDLESPSFICYGIPGTYDIQPPDELKDMCVWLPVNIDDKYGDGYWVIYQSAVDGKIIK